jgi:hypothetical protein
MNSRLMMKWDPKKMDFVLNESHPLKKFIQAIADPKSVTPKASEVISIRENKLFLGDTQLKDLPDLNRFRKAQGGVTREELKGTILDPSDAKGFYYLDLGETRNIGLLGTVDEVVKDGDTVRRNSVSVLGDTKHRYIPIPKSLMRLKTTADGISLGKTHPAYNILRAFSIMQSNPESMITGEVKDVAGVKGFNVRGFATQALREGIQDIFDKIKGKNGLLHKMSRLNLKTGFGVNLIPQQTTLITPQNFDDIGGLFESAMSRKQVIAALEMRKGMFSPEEYKDLIQKARKEKFLYSAIIADPTQRLEHTFLQRVRLVDSELMSANLVDEVTLNLQMHPVLFKMMERDTDADRVVAMFLRGDVKQFEDRIARQSKAMQPMLQFFSSEMRKAKTLSSAAAMEEIQSIFSAWAGQKMYASLGYSEVRPTLERLMPMIYSEGAEGLMRMGVDVGAPGKITRSQIDFIRSLSPSAREFSGSLALSQYIFQGGVVKGGSKYGLQELSVGLMSLADKTSQSGLNIENAMRQSHEMFYKFLSASDKNRIFAAGGLIEELLDKGSTPKVLEGLVEGAGRSREELRLRKAAAMLASTVGIGYAIAPLTPNVSTVASIAEDASPFQSVGAIFKRIINPVLGLVSRPQTAATGEFIGPQPAPQPSVAPTASKKGFAARMTELKEEILGDMSKLGSSKYLKPTVYGIAALAGIGAYNRLTAPDLSAANLGSQSLPPPTDTSTPMDMGPTRMPPMNSMPRINTSSFTPSAGRNRINQNFGSVKTNFFENSTNSRVIIDNRTSGRQNSWLLRRQMDMESESDFAY